MPTASNQERTSHVRELDRPRHRVEFPPPVDRSLEQDEAYFYLSNGKERTRIRFHDYAEIFSVPGLYELVVQDHLECASPRVLTEAPRRGVRVEPTHNGPWQTAKKSLDPALPSVSSM